MTISMQSPYLQFTLDSSQSTWSLHGHRPDSPFLEDVWMQVNYHMGLTSLLRTRTRRFQFLDRWGKPRLSGPEPAHSPHGNLEQVTVEIGPDVNGILYRLVFALSENHPLFFWQVHLSNQGQRPIFLDRFEMLRAGFFPRRQILPNPGPISLRVRTRPVGYGVVRPSPEPGQMGFFSNGWQSWSHTGAYGPADVYRGTRLGPFAAPIWYSEGKSPKRSPGLFTSDMFGVIGDRDHRSGILMGFASQQQHFGSLQAYIADPLYPAVRLWAHGDGARLDPGSQVSTDWGVIQFLHLDDPDPLAPYLDAVARQNDLPTRMKKRPSFTGWCSWYQYFQDIDQEKIRKNLEAAKSLKNTSDDTKPTLPLEVIQIDDGFEAQVGDWTGFAPGFPAGVAPLAEEIRDSGFVPGLWLAPFILHARSKFARNHRDLLLRNRFKRPVNAGFVWNNFNKAVDLTRPGALDFVSDWIRTAVQDWGFPYLKLDFLYASALKGRYHDRTKTRAQVLRSGLETIRAAAGSQVTLLGCGVPLGSSIGIFDAVRIGADVAPTWLPNVVPPKFFFSLEPNIPSARNAIQNTLTRACFHQRWWVNDPDCLLLRPDSDLTLSEVQSLATAIALTGGAMLISDDLTRLPPERLHIMEQLLPLIDKRPRILDWFGSPTPRLLRLDFKNTTGEWTLLAVFNWDDISQEIKLTFEKLALPPGDYTARDFWTGEVEHLRGEGITLKELPSHGVRLLSLRPVPGNQNRVPGASRAIYLGSDLHISQGLEVINWELKDGNRLRMELERPGRVQGLVDLWLPGPPEELVIHQGELDWHPLGNSCYRFRLSFIQSTVIKFSWKSPG